ncbi:MAG: NAD(P)H-hydrate epimerase [Enterocloster sp.]
MAVDIPSGIDADTDAVMGIALKADVTVTFGWEKMGIALYPGRSYAGKVLVKDICFLR